MKCPSGISEELLKENSLLKQKIKELEKFEAKPNKDEEDPWRNDYPYHVFFDLAPDPMAITDLDDGRIIDVNQAFVAQSHYSRDALIGRTTTEVGIWVNNESRNAILNRLSDTGFIDNIALEFKIGNNEIRQAMFSGRLVEIGGQKCLLSVSRDITERTQTETIARNNEEKYHRLFDMESDAIFLIDNETGQILEANKAASFLYGYSKEELLRKNHKDLSAEPERTREATHKELTMVPLRYHRKKDGTVFPVEITATHLVWNGRKSHLAAIRDITERKRAEEALRESKRQYDHLVSNIPVGAYLLRTTKNGGVSFKYVSPRMAEILAMSAEAILANPKIVDLSIHPEEFDAFRKLNRERIEAIQPFLWEGRVIVADTVKWLRIESHPEQLNNGDVLWHGIVADITERKQMEAALRKSEEQYRSIFENSIEGIYQTTREGKFLMANPAFFRMLGYDSYDEMVQSITNIPDQIYVNPEDRKHIMEIIERDGEVRAFETQFYKKDGNKIWVSVNMWGIYDERGKFLYFQGIEEDITEHKHLEAQLLQSQKMEAIGTLAGGIAHDFNNILTALNGYGSLLLKKMEKTNPLRHYVDQILAMSQNGAELIRSLLVFSRQQAIRLKPVNINTAIKGTAKLLKRLLTEDIMLDIHLAREDIIVMADITQIDQVLMNLATNARDAMPRGGKLTIETRITEINHAFIMSRGYGQPGAYVLITVSDTGVGMDKETIKRIFDPFFTTKEVGKGTGLGLSTVYGIVKQHNGYINAESESDHGTTFHIYIPLVKTKAKAAAPAAALFGGGGGGGGGVEKLSSLPRMTP
ncbi:MAG: Blue-light-activated protein [Syntrophorhabdus sp. PtaU1.Bin058]|nr:MAG: Blue-light-activated protein [Syntrophorhabdus sp. PtaU1.Bin058]